MTHKLVCRISKADPRTYCSNSHTVPKKASDLAAEDDIREAFRVFDRDGNGHISRDEMKAVMMNIGKLGFESEIRVGHKVMEYS